jgi:hypothetical protein
MTKLIDHITTEVLHTIPLTAHVGYAPINIQTFITDEGPYGKRIQLNLQFSGEVVCVDARDLHQAKERLIENIKYMLYHDLLEHILKLRDALYNFDLRQANICMDDLYREVTR